MPRGIPNKSKKKGRPSWDEASTLLVYNKAGDMFEKGDDGFRYRWETDDPHRIQIQKARGWEIVSDMATTGVSRGAEADSIDDGKQMTSVNQYKELVLMRLPEEDAKEREQYMQEKSDRQMQIVTGGGTAGHDQINEARQSTGGKISEARTNVRIS